jgi:peptide deformylase
MIREIVKKDNMLLRQRSAPLLLPNENLLVERVACDLRDTLQIHASVPPSPKGIGLAAPQISEAYRIFALLSMNAGLEVFVNPVITWMSTETDVQFEGCLSFIEVRGRVKRSLGITIEYSNEQGHSKSQTFSNALARIVQHEIDHLDGVLYDYRMPSGEQLVSYEDYRTNYNTSWVYGT